jgi:hypothetical protein
VSLTCTHFMETLAKTKISLFLIFYLRNKIFATFNNLLEIWLCILICGKNRNHRMSIQDILFLSISLSSILSPFHLHSVFLPVPFFPSLSFRYIYSTCAQLSFSPHGTFCIFFLSFHPIPVFSLLVARSKSPHHFPFSCAFSPQVPTPEFPLSYISLYCIWILWFFPFFLACLRLCPFHPALHSSIFLLLLIFPLLHWYIRFSDSISISVFFFLVLLQSSLPAILYSNFAALFPAFTFSLFLLHSSLTM